MKDFKKMVKMADGGSVEKYQDSPDYIGKEDYSPAGRKAAAAANKAGYESEQKDPKNAYRRPTGNTSGFAVGVNKAAVKAAKDAIAQDREQVKTMSNVDAMGNPMKSGGKVKRGNKKK